MGWTPVLHAGKRRRLGRHQLVHHCEANFNRHRKQALSGGRGNVSQGKFETIRRRGRVPDRAYDRLDDFRHLILQAANLLSGREFDRSKLKSDPEPRETLERLQNDHDDETRRIAGEYLQNLDLIDDVLAAAREIRHP